MFSRNRFRVWSGAIILVTLFLAGNRSAAAQDKSTQTVPKGQRVFSCGHSFHYFMPPILSDIADSAKITDHKQIGLSKIGGSRVIQHWNVPEKANQAKKALTEGIVDVLTLAPIYLPDEGIENFTKLAFDNNPNVRVNVQEFWLPYDVFDEENPLKPRKVDHNAQTGASLKKEHQPYFKKMDAHITDLNKKFGKKVLYIVPVGQAVIALREKIIDGKAPGLKNQEALFTDAIGHARAPLEALVAYCHYAAIYKTSPVGLPVPGILKETKLEDVEKLNTLLQELAWDAVTHHPLSGVPSAGKAGQ
jgi:hypothetical protein